MADVEMGSLDSPNAQLMFMQEMNRDFVEVSKIYFLEISFY